MKKSSEGRDELRGTVERVVFCNEESGFTIARLRVEGRGGSTVSILGEFLATVGDRVELEGAWEESKYGPQLRVSSCSVTMDDSPDALASLLASAKEFEGVGPSRARKIVDAAIELAVGDEDFSTALVDRPAEVARRAGVPIDVVRSAARAWDERREHYEVVAALIDQGWTGGQAARIVAKFGADAPLVVKRDPYYLVGRVARFGFRTVDAVALKMGVEADDPRRLAAGIAYCLDRIAQDGNTWTSRAGLIDDAVQELRPDSLSAEDAISDALRSMIDEGYVVALRSPLGTEVVADAALAATEGRVFEFLMKGLEDELPPLDLDGASESIASLNEGQAAALAGFVERRVVVISGRAGTGKTFLMSALCDVAESNGLRVGLCAPTGKAARRLAEATGRDAQTIHKMLAPVFEGGRFRFTHDARNPMRYDVVVVDETSMVDVRLMDSLIRATKSGARLVLAGDHCQIPSVGPGAVLRDLLRVGGRRGEAVHVLTDVVRQAGTLGLNTVAILDGILAPDEGRAWFVRDTGKGDRDGAAAQVARIFESMITSPRPWGPFDRQLDPVWDVQVLSPTRKGPLGTRRLNQKIQEVRQRLLGNPAPPSTAEDRPPKPLPGDRVIWTQNDYELGLLNGTQAIFLSAEKGGSVRIQTDDGEVVEVPSGKRDRLEVAWAITVHKAQGSEWPVAILVGSMAHRIMHDRHLFYTGASRASEALVVVGDRAGLRSFVSEQRSANRQTFGAFFVAGWSPLAIAEEEIPDGPSALRLVVD